MRAGAERPSIALVDLRLTRSLRGFAVLRRAEGAAKSREVPAKSLRNRRNHEESAKSPRSPREVREVPAKSLRSPREVPTNPRNDLVNLRPG